MWIDLVEQLTLLQGCAERLPVNNNFVFSFFLCNPLLFLNNGQNQSTSAMCFSICKPGCGKRCLTGLRWNQICVRGCKVNWHSPT